MEDAQSDHPLSSRHCSGLRPWRTQACIFAPSKPGKCCESAVHPGSSQQLCQARSSSNCGANYCSSGSSTGGLPQSRSMSRTTLSQAVASAGVGGPSRSHSWSTRAVSAPLLKSPCDATNLSTSVSCALLCLNSASLLLSDQRCSSHGDAFHHGHRRPASFIHLKVNRLGVDMIRRTRRGDIVRQPSRA